MSTSLFRLRFALQQNRVARIFAFPFGGDHLRFTQSEAHLHELRRASEPDDADAHAPLHAPDQCVLQEIENHMHMVALYTVFYNWTKIHKTLRTTPAMAAGLRDRVWDMADVVALIEESEVLVPAAQAE